MKFLTKHSTSEILSSGLTYKKNSTENNRRLKARLLEEQQNFCAYTEKYIEGLDATEVEHFNAGLKYQDDYYNYYAVIREANLYKKDEDYRDAPFFASLFFQHPEVFSKRISFHGELNMYMETNEEDTEARDLIDFLGFNNRELAKQRSRHLKRLKRNFKDAGYNKAQCLDYLQEHPEDLSFITAIEQAFDIRLEEVMDHE